MQDIIEDLAALIHPMPNPPSDDRDEEGWSIVCDDILRERQDFERNLRLVLEYDEDVYSHDPLLTEIRAARNEMLRAGERMRLLIAYGREFTRPRPYRLDDLARAAGMSISGVRTAYADDEVAEVAKRTGAKPIRPIG